MISIFAEDSEEKDGSKQLSGAFRKFKIFHFTLFNFNLFNLSSLFFFYFQHKNLYSNNNFQEKCPIANVKVLFKDRMCLNLDQNPTNSLFTARNQVKRNYLDNVTNKLHFASPGSLNYWNINVEKMHKLIRFQLRFRWLRFIIEEDEKLKNKKTKKSFAKCFLNSFRIVKWN